jgi:hypothetical protein
VSSIWFFLSIGQVAIGACSCKVVRFVVVFTRWQLHCPTAAILSGQLLPLQGGTIQF